jgi:putative transposase
MDYHIPLLPGETYHVFSHVVGSEQLFRCRNNYEVFLQRYYKHIMPVAETFTWNLLPNHFHFLIRVLPEEKLSKYYVGKKGSAPDIDKLPDFVMQQFSNWLNSYAKTYNLIYQRRGALFVDYLKRVAIASDHQFTATVLYVNNNAQHHGICKNFEEWEWCGYHELVGTMPTMLLRNEVLDWFGGLARFKRLHNQQPIRLPTL